MIYKMEATLEVPLGQKETLETSALNKKGTMSQGRGS